MLKEFGDTLYGLAAIQAAIPTPSKDWWDKAAVLAAYLLVIVGALGIIYAGLTLGKLKEQATAAKVAAEAALRQTDHIVASERAWLVISSVNDSSSFVWSGPPHEYWWQVRNVGNTPAILIATQAVCRVADSRILEETPPYPDPENLNERVLAPGDSIDFSTMWSHENGLRFKQNVEEINPLILVSFGSIKYKTVFSPKICEARFCDEWIALGDPRSKPVQPMIFKPLLGAPPEYTKHT